LTKPGHVIERGALGFAVASIPIEPENDTLFSSRLSGATL
jgi:hypothetical protein